MLTNLYNGLAYVSKYKARFLSLVNRKWRTYDATEKVTCFRKSLFKFLAITRHCKVCEEDLGWGVFTWKWGLDTHLAICLKSSSWILTNWAGSITSRISSNSPRNITYKRKAMQSRQKHLGKACKAFILKKKKKKKYFSGRNHSICQLLRYIMFW